MRSYMRKLVTCVLTVALLLAIVPTAHMATVVAEGGSSTIHWVFSSDGTLTISGTGDMENLGKEGKWTYTFSFRTGDVKTVVIKSGVTSIMESAFSGYSNLTSVSISNTIYFRNPQNPCVA